MTLTVEEEKAVEHLADERRREAFQRFLLAKLTPDPSHAARVKKNFAPLTTTGKIKGQES